MNNLLRTLIREEVKKVLDESLPKDEVGSEEPEFIWADDPDTGWPITDKNGNSVGYWESNPNVYWTWDGKELKIADMGD